MARVKNYLRDPMDDSRALSSMGCMIGAIREISLANCSWQPARIGVLGNLWERPDCPILYVIAAVKGKHGEEAQSTYSDMPS